MVTLVESWRAGRSEKTRTARARPILITIFKWAGRRFPSWRRVRTGAMQVTAFGFLDYAAWSWHHLVGYVAIGVSLLILEALGGEK